MFIYIYIYLFDTYICVYIYIKIKTVLFHDPPGTPCAGLTMFNCDE